MTESELFEILPSGSGIDCQWEITTHNNGNITARNSYHAMNQDGYYDGYMPFTVRIFRHKKTVWQLLKGPLEGKKQLLHTTGDVDYVIICNDKRRVSFYDLKDYLYQTFDAALKSIITDNGNQTLTINQ